MADDDRVETADYYAELQCEKDICEYRIRRKEYNSDEAPTTVASAKGIRGREKAKKEALETRNRVRYENGWVRIFDHDPF